MVESITISLKSRLLAALAAATMLIAAGCADDPSPVGSTLLPAGDLVAVDSLVIPATASSGEKAIPIPFSAVRTIVALGNSDGFEAWTFLLWSGFPDSLANATLVSSDVHLEKVYHVGPDSLASIPFSIHKSIGDWNHTTFVFDSLSNPGIYGPSVSNSTLGLTGEFSLDTAVVREWIRSVSDTTYKNFGIVLKPEGGTVIRGFRSGVTDSVELRPTLTIRYYMTDPGQEDTLVMNIVTDKYVAGMADTTLLADSTRIPIRGGAAYRGKLDLDVSAVPQHAAIHRAFLDLTFDAASSRLAPQLAPSLLALYSGVNNPVQTSEILTTDTLVYRFNVTEFVQSMVRGGNVSIRFAAKDEEDNVGLFMMHGAASSNTALRPRVTILYSPTR